MRPPCSSGRVCFFSYDIAPDRFRVEVKKNIFPVRVRLIGKRLYIERHPLTGQCFPPYYLGLTGFAFCHLFSSDFLIYSVSHGHSLSSGSTFRCSPGAFCSFRMGPLSFSSEKDSSHRDDLMVFLVFFRSDPLPFARFIAPKLPADHGADFVDYTPPIAVVSEGAGHVYNIRIPRWNEVFLLFDPVLCYISPDFLDFCFCYRQRIRAALSAVRALAVFRKVPDAGSEKAHRFHGYFRSYPQGFRSFSPSSSISIYPPFLQTRH